MARVAKRIVASAMSRTVETKQSSHNIETRNILHDEIALIDSGLFKTTQGISDPMNTDSLNRIGDEVNIRGLSIRFILEMPVYMSDVTYRAMIIKSAKGDVPQMATLWNGLSPCKILDTINTERFTVVYSKTFKILARNMVTGGLDSATTLMTQGAPGVSTGTASAGGPNVINSAGAATRVCKIWIPGSKLFRNSVIRYENGTQQTKFFDYHFIMTSYVNAQADTSNTGSLNSGFLKHYICQMYYKDA
jgi:hypothetical protein